jgi:ABC-type glycerol-3-phosphate transport system substrate-binding protein
VALPWQTPEFQSEFEKEFPGITLTVSDAYEYAPEPWEAYENADLYAMPTFFYREAQRRGLIGDWEEILGPSAFQEIQADLPEALTIALGLENLQYLVPILYTPLALIYNKRIFEAAGISSPRFYWSESDFLEACRRVSIYGESSGLFPFLCDFSNIRRWPLAIAREGGRLWSEDGERCLLDSPACLRGIQFYKMLVADLKYARAHVMTEGPSDYSLFLRDRVAIQPATVRTLENLESEGHLDWGIASIPEGAVRGNPCNAISLAVSPQIRDSRLAAEFIQFIRRPEYMSRYSSGNYSMLIASRRAMREFLSRGTSPQARSDMEAMLRLAYEFGPQEYPANLARLNKLKQLIQHVWIDLEHAEERCREICAEINQVASSSPSVSSSL